MQDKLEAIGRILGEDRFSTVEALMLIHMVENSATNHICSLSISRLAEKCSASRNTIREAMAHLERDGCLVTLSKEGHEAKYVPFPFCLHLIEMRTHGKPTGRLTIEPFDGDTLYALLLEKEASLTLDAKDHDERKRYKDYRDTLRRLDSITRLKYATERFLKRSAPK